MKVFEVAMVVLLTAGGIRSLWLWSRRHFESTDVLDQVLYALYLTGRIGLWFAFAGLFLIYALIGLEGQALVDEVQRLRWYVMVPVGLAALQLLAGFVLGRRSPGEGS